MTLLLINLLNIRSPTIEPCGTPVSIDSSKELTSTISYNSDTLRKTTDDNT